MITVTRKIAHYAYQAGKATWNGVSVGTEKVAKAALLAGKSGAVTLVDKAVGVAERGVYYVVTKDWD